MSNTIKLAVKNGDDLGKKLTSLVDIADYIEDEVAGQICEAMRNTAVNKITDQGAVDTGALRQSIITAQDIIEREGEDVVSAGIKTDIPYAIFIEYGTGPKGDPAIPHTSKRIWFQQNPDYDALYPEGDPQGRDKAWIPRYPQKPRPFMRPALYDNTKVFKALISGAVTNIFEEA